MNETRKELYVGLEKGKKEKRGGVMFLSIYGKKSFPISPCCEPDFRLEEFECLDVFSES